MSRLRSISNRVLIGPTAAGKTDVAHELAGSMGAGIISADAMMVYCGMNIGTAKPSPEERGAIPYAGIDMVEPDRIFSVHDYLENVDAQTASLPAGHEWLIAGGTGLYVSCLLRGIDENPGTNKPLRDEGEMILAEKGFAALKTWCETIIPDIGAQLPAGDKENPRRWIRAVERGGGKDRMNADDRGVPEGVRIVGLRWSRPDLEARIVRRVKRMYADGLLDEMAALRQKYSHLSATAAKAIGYSEAADVLDGRIGLDEAIERTAIRTRQYAKRQMTWFRNQFDTYWVDVTEGDSVRTIAGRVQNAWEGRRG